MMDANRPAARQIPIRVLEVLDPFRKKGRICPIPASGRIFLCTLPGWILCLAITLWPCKYPREKGEKDCEENFANPILSHFCIGVSAHSYASCTFLYSAGGSFV